MSRKRFTPEQIHGKIPIDLGLTALGWVHRAKKLRLKLRIPSRICWLRSSFSLHSFLIVSGLQRGKLLDLLIKSSHWRKASLQALAKFQGLVIFFLTFFTCLLMVGTRLKEYLGGALG
jgi:hypothetical protein